MNSPNKIGDYFSRRFPFFTIFSNASYPELAYLVKICYCSNIFCPLFPKKILTFAKNNNKV